MRPEPDTGPSVEPAGRPTPQQPEPQARLEEQAAELRQLHERLAQETKLRREAEEVQQKLRAALRRSEIISNLGTLVAGVAHEVRNPLFGISATLDAFEAAYGSRGEFQRYVSVLRAEIRRLNSLMNDLLHYGRPHTPRLALHHLRRIVAEAVKLCAPLVDQHGVQVEQQIPRELPRVLVDDSRLVQVFRNLLENSIQHSAPAQTVSVAAREVQAEEQRWLQCTVTDQGKGIAEEDLPSIFRPFYSRRRGGTGLGLSIVQRIVEEHEGRVWAASTPGGGATFHVRLPLFGGGDAAPSGG